MESNIACQIKWHFNDFWGSAYEKSFASCDAMVMIVVFTRVSY